MKTKSNKLPHGLPKLPPVPKGYDRWCYRPFFDSCGPVGAPFGAWSPRVGESWAWHGRRLGKPNECTHGICEHYIVAVRDSKPTPKKPRPRKVKAKVEKRSVDSGKGYYVHADFLIVPFDAASREQLVEQAVDAVQNVTGERNRVLAVLSILHPDFTKEAK